jgi:predicted AlkP superfamily phosphohydrolase/phosphomutase
VSRGLTVIGLDAATFDVIDPLVEAGELPNLARVLRSGARGTLHSTTHPLTPLAWTTMVTGVNAGRHGIWDFVEREESGHHVRLVNGSHRRAPAVWDLLSAAGKSVGVVNVPFTWPAPKVNGFSIAGLDASAREDDVVHPAGLADELRARFGPLALDHAFPLGHGGAIDLGLVRRVCEQRVEVVSWLAERFDPELLFVVFMSADHIHHLCWPEWERDGAASPVADVYRLLDDAVGDLLAAAGSERDVLVVSDHGGGSLEGVVNLNAWLEREGYFAYAEGRPGLRSDEARRRLVHSVFALQRKLPRGLRGALKRRLPNLRERALELKEFTVADWQRTRAFSYGTFGNIVLNVRGREQEGIVEPGEEYEALRDEIAARLLELRSPDGETIVAAVHRREDLFHGEAIDRLPDLVVEFDRYAWLGKGTLTRRGPLWDSIEIAPGSEVSYVGSHRHEGVVALTGPSALEGAELAASIEDVAPTILYLLGEPIPYDLDGRLLAEAIEPALLDRRPPEYAEPAQVGELAGVTRYDRGEGEVEGRLRSLGYIE